MSVTPPAPSQHRGGRRHAAGSARDQLIRFRVTQDEAAAIQARASSAGVSLSDYMRSTTQNTLIRSARRAALDPVTLHHLALLGSNMNQIARVLNATGDTERAAGLDELTGEVRTLLDRIRGDVR